MQSRSLSPLARLVGCAVIAAAGAGCQQGSDSPQLAAAHAAAPSGSPCRLLQMGEVESVFSGAKDGEVDNSRQQYGISACIWPTARNRFAAQYWSSVGASARDEASGLMLAAIDPLKGPSARNNIRYEEIAGVGEEAVAIVEPKDESRGVLDDVAVLVARRGDHILVLTAPELVRSERTQALRELQALGKSAVERL